MFQHLIAEIAEKFGFSLTQSERLVREILRAFSAAPGGLSEVLRKLKAAGIAGEPASWLASKLPALTAAQVTNLVGTDTVKAVAAALHIPAEQAGNTLAYGVPKVFAVLAPGGQVPAGLPADAVKFLEGAGGDAHGDDHGHAAPAVVAAAQKPKLGDWAVRGVVFAAVLGLLWWLTPRGELPSDHAKAPAPATASDAHAPAAQAPVAQAPATQAPAATAAHAPAAPAPATPAPAATAAAKPAEPAKTVDPTLTLKEANGTVTYGGVVPDEATRTGILSALGAAFGADKISGNLALDPKAGVPSWLASLPTALGALKFPGLDALFNAQGLTLNSLPPGFDRNKLLAALSGLFGTGQLTLPPAPAAAAPAPATPAAPTTTAPAAPMATAPSRLWLREIDGTVSYDGVVPDEATKSSITSALSGVFGADKLKGDLTVNPNVQAPSWLTRLGEILGLIKGPGFNVGFNGDGIDLKALAPSIDRDKLLAALKGLFPSGNFTLADLNSPQLDPEKVLSALDALKSGYSGADVTSSLNQLSIQFDTDSSTVPGDAKKVLLKAAELIKALPAGARIVIEGYTDNVGDPAYNLNLSQQRADAVREIFVEAGIDGASISSSGYGQSNPVASNDTPEGRARNRRITYELRPH